MGQKAKRILIQLFDMSHEVNPKSGILSNDLDED